VIYIYFERLRSLRERGWREQPAAVEPGPFREAAE
jgi:hypothetical protein